MFSYEISLSCGTFEKHDREPLFGLGNTFDRGLPVVNPSLHPPSPPPHDIWRGEGEEHVLQGGKAGIPEENADRINF